MKLGTKFHFALSLIGAFLVVLLLSGATIAAGQDTPGSGSPVVATGQVFQAPGRGPSDGSATVSVLSLPPTASFDGGKRTQEAHEHAIPRLKDPVNLPLPLAPAGSNEVQDTPRAESPDSTEPQTDASPSPAFAGISETNYIPPDSVVAAGPNHIIAAVNADFAIYTKAGSLLYQLSAKSWFSAVDPSVNTDGVYDPQLIYDQGAGRWLLMYLVTDSKTHSWIVLSVSATSDPTGQWCNWKVPGDSNGDTPSGNWADFEGLALDSQALYVTTNQFTYNATGTGSFAYAKIRIIGKSQAYGPCSGGLSYYDFWNLTDPQFSSAHAFTIRPAITFGTAGSEYLLSNSPFETSTYVTLWSLKNPLAQTPSLSRQNVPVAASLAPPNADQLGGTGGTADCPAPCFIDTSDGRLLNTVYRNGSLWAAHAVAGGPGNTLPRARYLRIEVSRSPRVLEDVSLGADTCWYYYPGVATDQNSNFAMVFTRSCTGEYAGVRYAARASSDSTLQASVLVKAGEGNYLRTVKGRNRWGDYSGAALDPTDSTTIWFLGEYAATPIDTWATWVAHAVIVPASIGMPVAAFTYLPSLPKAGRAIQFTDTSTGSPTSWSWDFGDRSTAASQNPSKIYASPGSYTVTLTVQKGSGSNSVSRVVDVTDCFRCTRTLPPRATAP